MKTVAMKNKAGSSKAASRRKPAAPKRWSKRVVETSDALDLEKGVFARDSAQAIARSLKLSAERSRRKKTDAFRSAMSMLNFYINRAGKNLSPGRIRILEAAKEKLRGLFMKAG